MSNRSYQPKSARLVPYFDEKSGIDTDEKAFAFIAGVLFGKLIQVQGAKRFNVQSNALTWLRRGNITGRDLPAFHNKIREKLMTYGTDASAEVREVVGELSQLGVQLGDKIELDATATFYFTLLGTALAREILPSKEKEEVKQ
jgi:CRISPR-associated protein Csh1